MFCPKCGTKSAVPGARFCRECGADMGAAMAGEQSNQEGWSAPPRPRPSLPMKGITQGGAMRTVLLVAGALLLIPLALHLIFGLVVAGVVVSVALIATAIKLAPLIAIGFLVYWLVARQRRPHHSGRW